MCCIRPVLERASVEHSEWKTRGEGDKRSKRKSRVCDRSCLVAVAIAGWYTLQRHRQQQHGQRCNHNPDVKIILVDDTCW